MKSRSALESKPWEFEFNICISKVILRWFFEGSFVSIDRNCLVLPTTNQQLCTAGEFSYFIEGYPIRQEDAFYFSAGVGRSGTFMAIDRLLHGLALSRPLDVFGTVYEMRLERCSMVQNEVGKHLLSRSSSKNKNIHLFIIVERSYNLRNTSTRVKTFFNLI